MKRGIPDDFTAHFGTTGAGAPLVPTPGGGPGDFLHLPYMRAGEPGVAPAGRGPLEDGLGFPLAWYTQQRPPCGRNMYSDIADQGQKGRSFHSGVQGLDGLSMRVG